MVRITINAPRLSPKNNNTIRHLREQTKQESKIQREFPVRWTLDKSTFSTITYKGYSTGHKPSNVSGLSRLYYDRSKPFEKQIPFYNFYKIETVIEKPKAYIIPQGWWKVIELLKLNKVNMIQFKKDTVIQIEGYRIVDYKSLLQPFEAHHLNYAVKADTFTRDISFRKGDYYILLNQSANRFLIETLEPVAQDSYFAWNFFDAILGQKEGFSGYSFEDIAAEYLKTDPDLKNKLEQKRTTDTVFAKNGRAQLNFVYENSSWVEPDYLRYPVYRAR